MAGIYGQDIVIISFFYFVNLKTHTHKEIRYKTSNEGFRPKDNLLYKKKISWCLGIKYRFFNIFTPGFVVFIYFFSSRVFFSLILTKI